MSNFIYKPWEYQFRPFSEMVRRRQIILYFQLRLLKAGYRIMYYGYIGYPYSFWKRLAQFRNPFFIIKQK